VPKAVKRPPNGCQAKRCYGLASVQRKVLTLGGLPSCAPYRLGQAIEQGRREESGPPG
jgi:hypothetical protein